MKNEVKEVEGGATPRSVERWGDIVVRTLLDWFDAHGRPFPWRPIDEAGRLTLEMRHDPYVVMVSEVMLQQTTAARVVEVLPRFLAEYPTLHALADASTGDVLRSWKGMGYNRRAMNLQRAAQRIRERHDGIVPRSYDELTALPGIGPYTAGAILCFGYGLCIPLLDVNNIRVLSRLFHQCYDERAVLPIDALASTAAALLPDDAYRWNQALMDFGALICTARRPSCSICPVEEHCLTRRRLDEEPLFAAGSEGRVEPSISGVARRFWRGRIIEELREAAELTEAEIIRRVAGRMNADAEEVADAVRQLLETLCDEGIIRPRTRGRKRWYRLG